MRRIRDSRSSSRASRGELQRNAISPWMRCAARQVVTAAARRVQFTVVSVWPGKNRGTILFFPATPRGKAFSNLRVQEGV